MAQGKEWTKKERNVIIQSLKPYLEMGFSRNKACGFIGLTPSTLSNWVKDDPSLGMKLVGWENFINVKVISNLKDAIDAEGHDQDDKKKETSKWWAERKMKEDFSTRTETDLTSQGEKILIMPQELINKNTGSVNEPTSGTE